MLGAQEVQSSPVSSGVVKTDYGSRLISAWRRLQSLPGGAWLFSRVLGFWVPYTGTLRARVTDLSPGYARVQLRDRRKVRNHLNSIHAIALANLGEMTSGLCLITSLPPGVRGIVTQLSIEYVKKARGGLVAESRCTPPAAVAADMEHMVQANIYDATSAVVARIAVRWRLSPNLPR